MAESGMTKSEVRAIRCLDWQARYPNLTSARLPWVFISTSKEVEGGLELEGECLYSKEGWLLIQSRLEPNLLCLHKPVTGEKLYLPKMAGCVNDRGETAFSTVDGRPDCVVYVEELWEGLFVHVARNPYCAKEWEVYRHDLKDGDALHAAILCEMQIYCFLQTEGPSCQIIAALMIFNLRSKEWLIFPTLGPRGSIGYFGRGYILECGGEILLVDAVMFLPLYAVNFCRLVMDVNNNVVWKEMEQGVLEKKSWFLRGRQSFVVEEEGRGGLLYFLQGTNVGLNVLVRGLTDDRLQIDSNRLQIDLSGSFLHKFGWVDLGMHDQPQFPRSCIGSASNLKCCF